MVCRLFCTAAAVATRVLSATAGVGMGAADTPWAAATPGGTAASALTASGSSIPVPQVRGLAHGLGLLSVGALAPLLQSWEPGWQPLDSLPPRFF